MTFPTVKNDVPFEYERFTFKAHHFSDLDGDDEVRLLEVFVGDYEIDCAMILGSDANEELWESLQAQPFDLQHWTERIVQAFLTHPEREKHIVNEQHWAWDGE